MVAGIGLLLTAVVGLVWLKVRHNRKMSAVPAQR
jgi:hypothetical protein